ncbi:MAG TPA: MFS transporter [Candidatus Limnocylindrales bacterium]|nr:MFS transporter [Candidatus Limnocylindrales bacterium]
MTAEVIAGAPGISVDDAEAGARPTERLPIRQLLQISIYWLGINAIWGGVGIFNQRRVDELAPAGEAGHYLNLMGWIALPVVLLVQPTVGAISDYVVTRWGRRKPFIVIGATLDVVFLIGLANAATFEALVVFVVLLQFSSNFAQGPFQGYVPDLVPGEQVGLASALVGAMQTIGFVTGAIVISLAFGFGQFTLFLVLLGVVELLTAAGTVFFVREGKAARPRRGRSWVSIGLSAWGTDILREHSFVFLLLSRLAFLAGLNVFLQLNVYFLERSLGLSKGDEGFWIAVVGLVVGVTTAIATIPSGLASNRLGRKPMIYLACAIGAAGITVAALAPSPPVLVLGVTLLGAASGTFVAVDWALMTDIIPKASSGRFMGISNLAVGLAGPVALLLGGPIMDAIGGPAETGEGPRAAFLSAIALFALAAIFLRSVDPRPRETIGPAAAVATPA